ncbi:hypothetical protein [Profundibacter amoris]|uniref:Uncharacterized protein n=1 Tax=Profundibacter amoris TaxID=2171755 RepID=A0A347UCU4_9RHOB|nr:hypothetical protein [Profundibacter amoris]AXX96672.1 hypothetical protein BAR1_01190 [Profundibacter amoris]
MIVRYPFLALVFSLVFVLPIQGRADSATDLVFSTGVLDNIPQQKTVTYDHIRLGPEDSGLNLIENGAVSLSVAEGENGGNEAILEMRDNGTLRNRTPFPADAGNPLVMAFLESSLRSMAQITGGSPFYLRNRIKESLRSGGQVTPTSFTIDDKSMPATSITFQPFQHDKNAARMGDFANLTLTFVVSDDVPGGFVLFSAATPMVDGNSLYRETIRYSSLADRE